MPPSSPEDLSASGGLCALTIQAPEFYCNNKNSAIREIRAKKIKDPLKILLILSDKVRR